MRHRVAASRRFLSILDFDHDTLSACLELAAQFKAARAARSRHDRPLEGLHVALLFEKPSLRTRSTFRDRGARARRRRHRAAAPTSRSAGASRSPTSRAISSAGSSPPSFAPTRRTGSQEFAAAAPRLRVVNALTNEEHPCQALADCLTLMEALGQPARAHDRVRRRRQQRRDLARAGGGHARRARPVASPPGFELPGRVARAHGAHRMLGRRRSSCIDRSGRRRPRRRRGLHRRVDVDGPGRRSRTTGSPFRPVPGERGADVARAGRTRSSCTACPPIAATKSPTR